VVTCIIAAGCHFCFFGEIVDNDNIINYNEVKLPTFPLQARLPAKAPVTKDRLLASLVRQGNYLRETVTV